MSQPFDEDKEDSAGAPAWVVTYGDMMSLLLAFFVMMLSFSEVDNTKFKAFMGSLQEAFGVQNIDLMTEIPRGENAALPRISSMGESILDELNSLIPMAFPGGAVQSNKTSTLMIIPGSLLFESGGAELKEGMKSYLQEIARLLEKRPSILCQIEGHTDDRPISTARFPSNWELSAARAIAVVRFLLEESVPTHQLGAVGYADSRPLVANDSAENREKNRRVEFLFVERSETPRSLPSL